MVGDAVCLPAVKSDAKGTRNRMSHAHQDNPSAKAAHNRSSVAGQGASSGLGEEMGRGRLGPIPSSDFLWKSSLPRLPQFPHVSAGEE